MIPGYNNKNKVGNLSPYSRSKLNPENEYTSENIGGSRNDTQAMVNKSMDNIRGTRSLLASPDK